MLANGVTSRPSLVNNVLVCEIDERQFQTHSKRRSVGGYDWGEDFPHTKGGSAELQNTLLDTRKRLRGKVSSCVGPNEGVPPGIELFALPDGVSLSADHALRPRVHSFVLTSGAGERVYGFCHTHWHAVSSTQTEFVCSQLVAQAVKLSQSQSSSSVGRLPTEIFAPRAVCVVTGFPFHNCFVEYVQYFCEHHQVHSKDHDALAALSQRLYDQLNHFRVELVPHVGSLEDAPMEVLVVPTDWGEFRFPGMFEARTALPVCDLDFPLLLRLLSVTSIVQVISALLNESSMVFVSRHASNLTPVIEAMLALIFPFKWPYAYVPLLPFSLRDYLQVPHPFVVGAAPELLSSVPPHAFVVDLDANSVRKPENYKKSSLPASCQRRMAKAVLDFIETLSLPRYPVMSLTQWQYIRQEENKSETTSKTNLSTQVLLDSESAFDFDLINSQDVNECRSPPPEAIRSPDSSKQEEGSVNAKLVRAHMSCANLIGPRSIESPVPTSPSSLSAPSCEDTLSPAATATTANTSSSSATTTTFSVFFEDSYEPSSSSVALLPLVTVFQDNDNFDHSDVSIHVARRTIVADKEAENRSLTSSSLSASSSPSDLSVSVPSSALSVSPNKMRASSNNNNALSPCPSSPSQPAALPALNANVPLLFNANSDTSINTFVHDDQDHASLQPENTSAQKAVSSPIESCEVSQLRIHVSEPVCAISSELISQNGNEEGETLSPVEETNQKPVKLGRPASVARSLSVKLEESGDTSSPSTSLSPKRTNGQPTLPRSQTDMRLSRFKHTAVAPSILSRSRVTFTLRSRFMDVFCSMMKGYLLFLRSPSDNSNGDLFDYKGFLNVMSSGYRDYMSKFVKTHIFGIFVEERGQNPELDWFDLRIREVLKLTTLRSGLEAQAGLKGSLFLQEKSFLSSEWYPYQFSLHKSALSWSRSVARKTSSQPGITKLGRVDLKDGMTQMTIPSLSGPTAFPLTLSIFRGPTAIRVLESSHTFFFETEEVRRRLIRFVLARTTTASQAILQMFLDFDNDSSASRSYLASPVVHKTVPPRGSIERLTSSILAATDIKTNSESNS